MAAIGCSVKGDKYEEGRGAQATSHFIPITLYPDPCTLIPVLHSPLLNVLRAFSPKSSEKGCPAVPKIFRKRPRKGLFLRKNQPESKYKTLETSEKKNF